MEKTTDYALVRIADNIGDKAILAYNAAKDEIYDSGLLSPYNGEIEAAAGSLA